MSYTVLFVDDEPDLTEICCEIFSMEGFKTLAAESGSEALKIIADQRVDAIVSDAKMPNMTGLELLSQLRKEGYSNLFYLTTGMVEFDEAELARLGVSIVVSKPYDVDDLVARVKADLVNLS